MLVIGNGMLARAFAGARNMDESLVAFCSGVSHSGEIAQMQFDRERALLLETVTHHAGKKIIYFSSCAAEFEDTPYYRHKREMESCLTFHARNYLICRLPQAVGVTVTNTLVNGIVRKLRLGEPVTVIRNAKRNLIDVEDVVRLSLRLAAYESMRIDVTNGKMTEVEEIIAMISDLLDIQAEPEYRGWESGFNYDGGLLATLIPADDAIYANEYERAVLAKYVPMLAG